MKSLVLAFVSISCSVLFGAEVEVAFRSALSKESDWHRVAFDGRKLSLTIPPMASKDIELSEEDIIRFQVAIDKFEIKEWSGVWTQVDVLDGVLIHGRLSLDEIESEFIGSNGCPPGLVDFGRLVNKVSGRKIFGENWQAMENRGKQFQSMEHAADQAGTKQETNKPEMATPNQPPE